MADIASTQAQDLRQWIKQLTAIGEEIGISAGAMRQDSPGGIVAADAMMWAEDSITKAVTSLERALAATSRLSVVR